MAASPMHAGAPIESVGEPPSRRRRPRWPRVAPSAWAMLCLGALAASGPVLLTWWLGYGPAAQHLGEAFLPPSAGHLCGTDLFGRDLLLRTLMGLRMSLLVGLGGAGVAVAIGTLVGAVSGYFGGFIDSVLSATCNVLYALPMLFLAIILVTLFGQSAVLVFVALGVVGWLTSARMVRAHVLSERQRAYVAALRLLGAGHGRILWAHILPNSRHVVAAAFALSVPAMVLEEAFLSFLGLGVPPPGASLGALVGDGMQTLRLTPWPLVVPATTMVALVWCLHQLAASLSKKGPG